MKPFTALLAGLIAAVPALAADGERPALLIVGAPHFDNPGQDIVNIRIADVTTPERQREIEAIVERLAAFRPTRVAVEWSASRQDRLDARYNEYRAGRYRLSADERDQIGLRLAARLGLERVHAVDWNEMPPGVEEDYDYPAWAEANGQGDAWRARVGVAQAEVNAQAALMPCTPVSSWLRKLNLPSARAHDQRRYYEIAAIGDNTANPGAAWVGSWYARNLRILNNLRALAGPDERVVVIYGAGHGYLLDRQARESGWFDVADTLDHLPASPRDAWTRCPD
ncbi:MAG: hypothetical protein KF780_13205 [Sphingomonas sp.]|nr:hypothetical protein [Sphingomonas sp.]